MADDPTEPIKGYWDLTPAERAAGGGWDLKGDVTVTTEPASQGRLPAYAQGPDGPVEFNTSSGFEDQAATVQASAALNLPPGQLTPEEIAEFRALRAEKKLRDEEAAREAEEAAAKLQAPTHWVRLADGAVVQGSAIATHYDNGSGLVAVESAHELSPVLITA
jgi:hypothetical protein